MQKIGIGIFGGTFDPFHNGHLALVHSFLSAGKIEELWIVPTFDPPHKDGKNYSPYRNRLEMARIATKGMDKVSVSDIEQKITSPSYSFQTLGQFKKMFPFYDFYVCIGGDQLLNFHKWVLFDAILCMANLLVAERPGISYASIQKEIWEKTTFIEHKPIDVSSTQIRAQVKKGAIQPVKTSLDIRDYIVKNKLYLK
ncbi:MAG: nicotinate (nicotinamide) nucleotide adenylyltransferase [Bacteroidetes bacterium]|nr:nicotinate (nicotinamide) nucleotide adenylyltransferase [Bacteroidota bacterium]NCQ10909.1 nicotinate (nicotinamide) nucleotide adenylyltransferase [Bacteroidota bacterium]